MRTVPLYLRQLILCFWHQCFVPTILITFPSFHASNASHLDAIIRHRSGTVHDSLSTYSLVRIKAVWVIYLNARIAEWRITFTFACMLVGLSLTMFQIPQAANDPVTYVFASLAQCRALSGLVYGAALSVYFDSEFARTVKFARVWCKTAVESEDKIWNTWIMLSLPTASTVWALLLYLFAVLSLILNPASDKQPTPLALTIVLRATIATTMFMDLICFTCICVTLKAYREEYNAPDSGEV